MVVSTDRNKVSRNNPTAKLNDLKNAVFGIYLAEIISTVDVSRTGRVTVFIPALGKDKSNPANLTEAMWSTPFGGSTDPRVVGTDVQDPSQTMSSYGFWGVVPDAGNLVLVTFADGNTKYPYVISCVFPDKLNSMLPGNSGNKNYQAPDKNLPTLEKNKRTADIKHNDTFRPIQHTLSESIVKQGLVDDPIRGPGNSSARRESPSEVFGLLSPGPRDPDNHNYRLGGHSITLDDNLASRNIRIRTAQGNQLLMDDTTGIIYMINKDGKAWMELNQVGDVLLYAEGSISMRAKGDFNIRADHDVNIEAGQNVNIKATGDTITESNANKYEEQTIGTPPPVGGFVNIESAADMSLLASTNFAMTAFSGDANFNTAGEFNMTSGKNINAKAKSKISTAAGDKISFSSSNSIVLAASDDVVVKTSGKMLVNSDGADAARATTASTTNQIGTIAQQDQGQEAPGYNRSADAPLTTNGARTGDSPLMTTIVKNLVTAEPYEGHAVPNPANENPASIIPDETLINSLPTGSNGLLDAAGNALPASANTPAGFQAGTGYTGSGLPQFGIPLAVANNFGPAATKQFLGTAALSNIASALGSSIPILRSPTVTAGGVIRLGIQGTLSEFSARLGSIGVDAAGAISDLQRGELQSMKNRINRIRQTARSPDDFLKTLKQEGIQSIVDGAGTIFVDANGRKIIDFNKGLGSISHQLILAANLGTVANVIRNLTGVPISDNQLGALVSFADHVGTDNYARSRALTELNAGNYAGVPNAMMEFNQGSYGRDTGAVRRDDYVQRRQYEGELFATPDGVTIPTYDSRVSFAQQARDLRQAREGYICTCQHA